MVDDPSTNHVESERTDPPDTSADGNAFADAPDEAPTREKIDEELQMETFYSEGRQSVLRNMRLGEINKPERPKETNREVTVLIIDSKSYQKDPTILETLRSEIKQIAPNRDFDFTQDANKNLVIISFTERGGIKKLLDIAATVAKKQPTARMLLKSVNFNSEEDAGGGFTITKWPQTDETQTWRTAIVQTDHEIPASIFIDKKLATQITTPRSRKGTNVEIKFQEISTGTDETANVVALIDYKRKPSRERGGPDILVGYEDEFDRIVSYACDKTPAKTVKIMVIEAEAGMGKSRITTELMDLLPPDGYIFCSLDAGDSTTPGSALVTLADELITIFEEDEYLGLELLNSVQAQRSTVKIDKDGVAKIEKTTAGESVSLQDFSKWENAKKIEFAANYPETMTQLCIDALTLIREAKAGNGIFILDDLHHSDEKSEPYLNRIMRAYKDGSEYGMVIAIIRKENIEKSAALKETMRAIKEEDGPEAVQVVSLNGLDFATQRALTEKFIYHALPPEIREVNKKPRNLGVWTDTLAKVAGKSPWKMTTLMEILKTNLSIEHDTVEVDRATISQIALRNEDDITVFFQERIAELRPAQRHLLHCVALMGGKATKKQMKEIMQRCPADELTRLEATEALIGELSLGVYLRATEKGEFELQHDEMKDVIIRSIESPQEVSRIANEVYDILINFDSHPETRHALLTEIAKSNTISDDELWIPYLHETQECFADAELHHDLERAYNTTQRVLNSGSKCMERTLQQLGRGAPVPPKIRELIIAALFKKAETARFLGKFNESKEAVSLLETIGRQYPEEIDLTEAYLILFEVAYMESLPGEMNRIYTELLDNGEKLRTKNMRARDIILKIKLEYKKGHFDDAIAIANPSTIAPGMHESANWDALLEYNAEYEATHNNMPSPEFVEVLRITTARIPYEMARTLREIDGKTQDSDVMMHDKALLEEQLNKIRQAKGHLKVTEDIIEAYPALLDPFARVNILDQKAAMEAHLGNYPKAIEFLDEAYRIATKLGIYTMAARAAKVKANIQIIQGKLDEAIDTLMRQGEQALSKVDDSFIYKFMIPAERIRAIAMKLNCLDLDDTRVKRGKDSRESIAKLVETALKDFRTMNDFVNNNPAWRESRLSPALCYDIQYIGWIIHVINEMEFNISKPAECDCTLPHDFLDPEVYPYMTSKRVQSGLQYGRTKVVDNTGLNEVARKNAGGEILERILQPL